MWILKVWVIFSVGLAVCALANAQAVQDGRIVGGQTTTIDNIPYIVQLYRDDGFKCGGSILSATWILTAAHCIFGYGKEPGRFKVRAGATYLTGSQGATRKVLGIYRSSAYDSKTLNNDVALLRVEALPLNGKTIKTIPLCTKAVPVGAEVRVSGWGLTRDEGTPSNQLRTVFTTVITSSSCQRKYSSRNLRITAQMFCAAKVGKDSCSGDSGGPLVHNNQLCGIVSWGVGCAKSSSPGVYTNVMNVRAYIKRITKL